jgi:hypothetical protein
VADASQANGSGTEVGTLESLGFSLKRVSGFFTVPPPGFPVAGRDSSNYGLPAGIYVDVFNGDLLLARP